MKKHTIKDIEEYLTDIGLEDAGVILFKNPDYADAFIGMSQDDRAIYDYNKMVECLVHDDGMDEGEAAEFIDYNTVNAHVDNGPISLMPVLEDLWNAD